MLDSKCANWQGMCENKESGERHSKSIWWRDIKQVEVEVMGGLRIYMMEWKIGDGTPTRFWKHRWLGSECLQYKFSRLFLN